jgi:hypothetical protein
MRTVSSVGARILQVLALLFIASISSYAASVTLAWDPNSESDLAGYRVLYGTSSGVYAQVLDAGNTTTAVVPNLTEGTTYYFVVKAYNTAVIDSTASAEISFTPPSPPSHNTPPTVTLTGPTNGSTYLAPASITLDATALDSDGTVARVEFYQGTTKLGEDSTSPYAFAWSGVAFGTYLLTARAIDNQGAHTDSLTATVTVNAPNQAPTIAVSSPADGSHFTSPANIPINAIAVDPDGSVTRVEFYNGATKLGEDTTSPYSYTWSNVASGTYALTAVAVDNAGNTTHSAPVSITVQSGNVVLTTNGTSFTPGATISLSASTSQLSGRVRRVEFYRDSVLLFRDTKFAYAYSWKDVPAGTFVLQAKAVMLSGATYTSAPVTVVVGASQPSATMAVSTSSEDPMPTVAPYRQQEGAFNLGITGQAGQTYKVWVSADLENWSLMTTVTNDIGFVSVTDPDAPNHKQRFYRVSVQE